VEQLNAAQARRALALAAALCAMAGCTKVATQSGTPAIGGNPHTIPGVLRWGLADEPDTLDPLIGTSQVDVDVSMFWAGYLFNWSDRNEYVPELAERVPTLANGDIARNSLSIVYHLRRGVKWQDGVPFGADDVIFSWQQVMNPRNFVGTRLGYDDISGIDKRDDHTIVVHLKKPFAPFIASFFTMSGTPIPILPKHLLSKYPDLNRVDFNRVPLGTGPFRVMSYEKGRLIKLQANQSYWRGAPKLKEVDITIVPDQNTLLTQLRTGEIDLQYAAPSSQAPSLANIPGTRRYLTPFTQYSQIYLNNQNPILSDVRVRRALAYGTDKRRICEQALHGIYTPADSDQPEFSWAYEPDVVRYAYDPAKANAELDQLGWKLGADGIRAKDGNRLTLTMTDPTGSVVSTTVAAILQSEWRAIGVDLTIKNVAGPVFFASAGEGGTLQSGHFDVALGAWVNGVDPDDSTQYLCDQWPPAGQNNVRFCDHRLDAAEQIALSSFDQSVRKRAYSTVQKIIAQEVPSIIVGFAQRQDVANVDLAGYKPAHAATTFWNTWEWSI
jgi:peptide/nickel transport system substrate-binding protein